MFVVVKVGCLEVIKVVFPLQVTQVVLLALPATYLDGLFPQKSRSGLEECRILCEKLEVFKRA